MCNGDKGVVVDHVSTWVRPHKEKFCVNSGGVDSSRCTLCSQVNKPPKIKTIELDFTYFVNNNPREVEIIAWVGKLPDGFSVPPSIPAKFRSVKLLADYGEWQVLVPRKYSKPYKGKTMRLELEEQDGVRAKFIAVRVIPDGGMYAASSYLDKQCVMAAG